MFGRSTQARRENEKDMPARDYKAALLELFSDMDRNFPAGHGKYIAGRYRKFFIQVSSIVDNRDCKEIYEGLVSGDPKLRTCRSLYQRIYTRYINRAKKERIQDG